MSSGSFEERRRESWQELDQLITSVERGKPAPGVEQLPRKFREACSDLGLATHRMYGRGVVERLNALVIRGYKLLYRSRKRGAESFVRFTTVTFPSTVRREWRLFWLCSLLFWGPFFAMLAMPWINMEWIQAVLKPEGMAAMESMYGSQEDQIQFLRDEYGSNFMIFGHYIQNNISIDFRMFAGGIVACLGTLFFMVYNGIYIGAAAGYASYACNPESFWTFVSGHSSFELLGMVVAGMAGMRLGIGVLRPGRMTRAKSVRDAAKRSLPLILGAAGMTFLAAVVEGFWSAQPLAASTKYGVGATFWVMHALYFLLMGRGVREA